MRQGSVGRDDRRAGVLVSKTVPAKGDTRRTSTRPSSTSDASRSGQIEDGARGRWWLRTRGAGSAIGERARGSRGAAMMVVGNKARWRRGEFAKTTSETA